MKVLLTGANGFVGSHVLDQLLARQIPVAVLLRPTSNRQLIEAHLPKIEVRTGSIEDPGSLDLALEGVTHVIHCAGATKALNANGFFTVNQIGTRNLVESVNRRGLQIRRFIHISSLAAAAPATRERPRREDDAPAPVSDYGQSKLAAEGEVMRGCKTDWVIVRPPAVYGPRDAEFLRLFKAVNAHLLPQFGGGRQQLTLVYIEDLAEAVMAVLTKPEASRRVFFAGSSEIVTAAEFAQCIASVAGRWTIPLPLPQSFLWIACRWAELASKITRKANVLNAQKWNELKAPGWVCDVTRMRDELGFECHTPLRDGVSKTLDWYRQQGWL